MLVSTRGELSIVYVAMNLFPWFLASFMYFCVAVGRRLPCLQKAPRRFRNPAFVQVKRCCGDIAYDSSINQCCKNLRIRKICEEWSGWGAWTSCSADCGEGERHRYRFCQDGHGCAEEGHETKPCLIEKCRPRCNVCHTSESNTECNNKGHWCKTDKGEGCQSIVRKENNFFFVEKRCKQMKACLIEGREMAMQKSCDPNKDTSMCIFCCTGDYCNEHESWEMPSWYTDHWPVWIRKLDQYSTAVKSVSAGINEGKIRPDGIDSAIAPLLLKNLPDDYGRISVLKHAIRKNAWSDSHWSPDVNKIFIDAIINATEDDQINFNRPMSVNRTMKNFVRYLEKNLPDDFRMPSSFKYRWLGAVSL